MRPRLAEAVEQALALGEGVADRRRGEATEAKPASRRRHAGKLDDDILFSAHYACTYCNNSYEPPSPQLFSFNSPHGMCPDCDGLGTRYTFDPDLLIPDPSLSFYNGAIPLVGPLRGMGRWRKHIYEGVAKTLGIDLKTPWQELPQEHRDLLLYGSGDRHITFEWKQRGGGVWKHGGKWEGIVPQLLSSFKKTAAGPRRHAAGKVHARGPLPAAARASASTRKRGRCASAARRLVEVCAMPVGDLAAGSTRRRARSNRA